MADTQPDIAQRAGPQLQSAEIDRGGPSRITDLGNRDISAMAKNLLVAVAQRKENAMKHVAGLLLSLGIAAAPATLQAQDAWPARPITFVVPYGAGGYTDLVARLTARYVEKALGKPVIVDNRAGAGGIVGTQAVANAAVDGYTFCVCSIGAISIVPFDPNQKVGYDPLRDLAPVGLVSSIAQVVIVKEGLPVKTLAELVSYAKANPGKLNYGSSGAGGLTHYSVELFQARSGIKVVHIPFKSGGPSTAAVVSGEVDFAFANMTEGLPQVKGGAVRGLAVTSLERSPYLPDLPTVNETVLPGFVVETWNGIMAPSKTPELIIRKLSEILIKMADDPEVKEIMARSGADTVKTTPEQFRAQIIREIAQWKPLIQEIAERK
jgi:tripartite-type tricarboxylate transporter receptor subunit TctC